MLIEVDEVFGNVTLKRFVNVFHVLAVQANEHGAQVILSTGRWPDFIVKESPKDLAARINEVASKISSAVVVNTNGVNR